MFHHLVTALGLAVPEGVSPPRLHDLGTRSRWGVCCAGIATGWTHRRRLFQQLATFMGHVDPASTAVYLTITPGLLAEANRRFEAFAEPAWRRRAMTDPAAGAARCIRSSSTT